MYAIFAKFNDVRPVAEWLYKYHNFDNFSYVNGHNQRQVYQINDFDRAEKTEEDQK